MILLALALAAQDPPVIHIPAPPGTQPSPVRPDPGLEACIENAGDEPEARERCTQSRDTWDIPLGELERDIALHHPMDMIVFAARLHNTGRKEEGLFWFYAGQLRWRTHLQCNPPQPGGEGALFGAMLHTVGPEINQYAASDVDRWLTTIDNVLEWDERTEQRFGHIDRPECGDAANEQREGLIALRERIEEEREDIAASAATRI